MVLLAGCSSSDKDAPAVTNTVPARMANPEQVRAALKPVLDAECSWLFKCCTTGELAQQLGPATSSDCADHLFQSSTVSYPYGLVSNASTQNLLAVLNYVQYGFDQAAVKIDMAAIMACAAKLATDDCNPAPPADHCTPVAPGPDDPCAIDKLLVGSLQKGADCTAYGANQCAPGLFCKAVANEVGVCIDQPAVGDLCLRDEDCGSYVCDWSTGKCAAGAPYGEACAFTDPDHPVPGSESIRCQPPLACDTVKLKCTDPNCASGINCSSDSQCPAGVSCVMNHCGPLREVGETCYQPDDCADGTCVYDSVSMRQLCTAPKALGASCNGSPGECASGYCGFDQTAMAEVCLATLKNGEMCQQGANCTSGKCGTDGKCAAVAAGDDCATDSDCAPSHDLFCVELACTKAPFPDGTACVADTQCKSQACAAQKCAAKGVAKDACGTPADPPCDTGFYCDVPAGKEAGKCAAKKAQGELCSKDVECASNCQASHGALRCAGEPAGVAMCGG